MANAAPGKKKGRSFKPKEFMPAMPWLEGQRQPATPQTAEQQKEAITALILGAAKRRGQLIVKKRGENGGQPRNAARADRA